MTQTSDSSHRERICFIIYIRLTIRTGLDTVSWLIENKQRQATVQTEIENKSTFRHERAFRLQNKKAIQNVFVYANIELC